MYGELIPLGGGDSIPLMKKELLVGRRESCDIVLRFPNVSAHHCRLMITDGYWYVEDLNSRNGVKVNSTRVSVGEKRVDPGAEVSIAKHKFKLHYVPAELGAVGPPPNDEAGHIFGRSLLERAGLSKRKAQEEVGVDDEYIKNRADAADPVADRLRQEKNRPR